MQMSVLTIAVFVVGCWRKNKKNPYNPPYAIKICFVHYILQCTVLMLGLHVTFLGFAYSFVVQLIKRYQLTVMVSSVRTMLNNGFKQYTINIFRSRIVARR